MCKRLKLSFLKLTILRPPLPWYNAPVIHHYRYFYLELVKLLSLSSIPQCLKLKIIQQTFKYWHLKTGKTTIIGKQTVVISLCLAPTQIALTDDTKTDKVIYFCPIKCRVKLSKPRAI